ncbi:chloride channel CLIC-like protein 1 [Eucyclogobius newberryi]|uniref:chloride channel CLIC-like protein 1 n=1 Tax=Eucyclogobius newberryi TaxID=166745 RepID=UPI003B5C468B
MHVFVLLSCLALAVSEQAVDDDWRDPYDMLNYDPTSQTMRNPAESTNYPNVPTKRRGHMEDSQGLSECNQHLEDLQKQIKDQQKKMTLLAQQPTCNPVFKRFLSRLVKEIERVGLPTDSTDIIYNAQVKVSKQTLSEIRALLDGEESWRTGALDNAISQILTDLRPHDPEAWKWRFEDTFGVELDLVLKAALCVLVIVAIICTELWSTISWFVQFRRLFAVCFIISCVWNWCYLYKIAFAEHQKNLVMMDDVNQKCTGVRKIDWSDSLKEWFRRTWTLQDDPCKLYYEVLIVNPILLVPPTKPIAVTITTLITEPLEYFGQGISKFLRALLKDLPFHLQIPVLLTIVLSILIVMYSSVNAAFQHGITAPFRGRRRDPQLDPPPERYVPRIEGGGDAQFYGPPQPHRGYDEDGGGDRCRNPIRQRPVERVREQRQKITVQSLGNMDHNRDEMDADVNGTRPDSEQSTHRSKVESESEGNVSMEQAEVNTTRPKMKQTLDKKHADVSRKVTEVGAQTNTAAKRGASTSESPQIKEDVRREDCTKKDQSPKVELQSITRIESIGHPVQETLPEAAP